MVPAATTTLRRRGRALGDAVSRTSYHHDTPSANLEFDTASTVEVVDPTHPLYGRQLRLIRFSTTLTGPGFGWVVYRDFMQLRIPLASTNLVPDHPTRPTAFTEPAIADLVSLVGAWGVGEAETTVCQLPRTKSGDDCPPPSGKRSATSSQPSSRR
jgi:hypothetical protein